MSLGPLYVFLGEVSIQGLFLFFKDFSNLYLERGEGKEKERKRNINVWLPLMYRLLGA